MGKNVTIVCLCVMLLFFVVGCNSSQQAKKLDANHQAMAKSECVKQGEIVDTFFEAYPENWEHTQYTSSSNYWLETQKPQH